jgi:hypothetical protein
MTYAIRNHNGRLLGYHPTKRANELSEADQ